jgi:hypothetical protein
MTQHTELRSILDEEARKVHARHRAAVTLRDMLDDIVPDENDRREAYYLLLVATGAVEA